ncbi:hypothetical protein [Actinophytocola sp.]|uniref:hypothetical protein n=1 Tax=Actinophytocola sp. TaxID=1872138 RepID=UPI002ED31181
MRIGYKSPAWNFVQHLLEMTIAMFVGMFVLGMPAGMLFKALDWTVLTEETVPRTLLMATYMSVGMAAWMRFRGCRWPAVVEMSLAMYVPFVIMYPFFWAGLVSDGTVMAVGHALMTPAMIVAMLFRLNEYTQGHHHHAKTMAAQPEG